MKNSSCVSLQRLTVFLAAYRYIFLNCQKYSGAISAPDRAVYGVSIVAFISIILCIPSYIEHRIVAVSLNSSNSSRNSIIYRFEETSLSRTLSIRETVFVLHSVIFKLIPCAFLFLFSLLLIQQLRNALEKSEILHRNAANVNTLPVNKTRVRVRRREKENRRTTMILVVVCVLFLVTELPQGALLLLTFLSKARSSYYFQVYQQLGSLRKLKFTR